MMIKTLSHKQHEQRRLQHQLLLTLQRLSPPVASHATPPEKDWCTTRQLADAHNLSIYRARILLLDMAKRGEVVVAPQRVNNTLRWYPSQYQTWRGYIQITPPDLIKKMAHEYPYRDG